MQIIFLYLSYGISLNRKKKKKKKLNMQTYLLSSFFFLLLQKLIPKGKIIL